MTKKRFVNLLNRDGKALTKGRMDMVDGTQEEPILAWVEHDQFFVTDAEEGAEFTVPRPDMGHNDDLFVMNGNNTATKVGSSRLKYSWDTKGEHGYIKTYFK